MGGRKAHVNVGLSAAAPHDLHLRRTFVHRGDSPIDQIQLSLGHSSVQTTERYLGVEQDLIDAPCDHLGLKLSVTGE
jgi:integrase